MTWNEYLVEYKKTNNEKYLSWFLHYYEYRLNQIITTFARRYFSLHYFDDLKTVYINTLSEQLKIWNFTKDEDFLFANKFVINDSMIKFIGEMGGVYSFNSENHFKALRRVSYMFFNTKNINGNELLEYISEKTKLTLPTVKKLLVEARQFYRVEDISQKDEDGLWSCFISNPNDNVEQMVERTLIQNSITDAIDKLSFKEQEIFLKSIGIECHYCGRLCSKQTYIELANKFQLSGESATEKLHKKARLAILTNLADENILDFVIATRVRENKKTVTYNYLPQGDKSAEKGVVVILKSDYTYTVETTA